MKCDMTAERGQSLSSTAPMWMKMLKSTNALWLVRAEPGTRWNRKKERYWWLSSALSLSLIRLCVHWCLNKKAFGVVEDRSRLTLSATAEATNSPIWKMSTDHINRSRRTHSILLLPHRDHYESSICGSSGKSRSQQLKLHSCVASLCDRQCFVGIGDTKKMIARIIRIIGPAIKFNGHLFIWVYVRERRFIVAENNSSVCVCVPCALFALQFRFVRPWIVSFRHYFRQIMLFSPRECRPYFIFTTFYCLLLLPTVSMWHFEEALFRLSGEHSQRVCAVCVCVCVYLSCSESIYRYASTKTLAYLSVAVASVCRYLIANAWAMYACGKDFRFRYIS